MRARICIIVALIAAILTGAGIKHHIDWHNQGFERMHTTCYVIQGVTAAGVPTHYGICACNTHLGDVAEVYTTDGEYLGLFECVDTGGTDGLKSGKVIDIWMPSMEEAEEWMAVTKGKVYVKWISGNG